MLELISERKDTSDFRQYTRLAIGTLVTECAHKSGTVTADHLCQWASAIRNAFSVVFREVWSVVVVTAGADLSGCVQWWFSVTLGDSRYAVLGSRYVNPDAPSVWSDRFNDLFIREFACQLWGPGCKVIADSLKLKYRNKFERDIYVVVVQGGLAGADFIGKSFSHCGYSVWIIAK
jgi:hypothetical protein